MFKRIDHVEILPSDFDKSIEFYQDVLELRLVSESNWSWPFIRDCLYAIG